MNHQHSSQTDTEMIYFSDTVNKVFEGVVDIKNMFCILSFHVFLPQCENRESPTSISIATQYLSVYSDQTV